MQTPARKRRADGLAEAEELKLPTVGEGKLLEGRSRTIFAELVDPWLVTDVAHDYGIDAIVEITRPKAGSNSCVATGKRFAVQLKATNAEFDGAFVAVRVRPSQVHYWVENSEPVVLAVCHVPSRRFLWRWVNASVIEELTLRDPTWAGQETVTISVPTRARLDESALGEIAAVATDFKPQAPRALTPGTYQRLQSMLTTIARKIAESADAAGLSSAGSRLADLERALRTSTYVVAITGPARAGKSTLLNAIVGRDLSPMGKLPTTAVSLMVVAGERNEAEVSFVDGEPVVGEASAAFLSEYATQDRNPHNRKRVRQVTVRLVNEMLENGVAYVDAPGLHDPSAVIKEVTESALANAHAILYVLDVAPARDGGFSIADYHLADLARLRRADRLFIVLNKADVLDDDERSWVASHVEERLREYGLWDVLPQPPLFVSARVALADKVTTAGGPITLQPLHDAIWSHLLATHSTGLGRISVAVTELQRASAELLSLLSTRRLDGAESFRLREALRSCRQRQLELVHACQERALADHAFARQQLSDIYDALLSQLRERLSHIPTDKPLPKTADIEGELQKVIVPVFTDIWREMVGRFQVFATHISQQVEESLQQARLASGAPDGVRFLLPQVPALNIPQDSFEEAWQGLFVGGLLGAIIGGPGAWLLVAGGWLAGLAAGRERQRKRQVNRIVVHVGKAMNEIMATVAVQVQEKIRIFATSLERHVRDRISIYVRDVETQLARLGEPLSPIEHARFGEIEQAVRDTRSTLELVCKEISRPEHLEGRRTE